MEKDNGLPSNRFLRCVRRQRSCSNFVEFQETLGWSPAPDGTMTPFRLDSSGFPMWRLPPGTEFPDRDESRRSQYPRLTPDLVDRSVERIEHT